MSVFNTLSWEKIYQPLPGVACCGEDLQYDADYDAIRRARQADGDPLPSGMWERPAKKIDWESVGEQCFKFLTQRSKDLQVSAWMVEAFVHGRNLEGAAHGMSLFSEMAMTFWADVHPQMENGDTELRLRPVNWLLREGLKWFSKELPMTITGKEGTSLSYESRHSNWKTLATTFRSLDGFLSTKIPDEAPNFREIHECLKVRFLDSAPPGLQATDSEIGDVQSSRGALSSRDAAYDQLREIAVFLSRVEPHSPVPMVLDALAAWRNIRFEDLLERLPAQGGASLYELLRLFKASSSP